MFFFLLFFLLFGSVDGQETMCPAWTNVMLHCAEAPLITVCLDEFVIDRSCHLFPLDALQFLEIYKILFPRISQLALKQPATKTT